MNVFRHIGVALLGLMVMLFTLPASAAAPNRELPVETAFLIDRSGDVAAMAARTDWIPFKQVTSRGYGPEPVWVRVQLKTDPPVSQVVLRLRPSYLDEVVIHLPQADGTWRKIWVGDRVDVERESSPDTALALDWVPPPGVTEHTLYVRVQTASVRMVSVSAYTPGAADRARDIEHTIMGVYFGIMLCVLVWALGHAVLDRDPVFAWFSLFQTLCIFMNIGLMGHARLHLSDIPRAADILTTSTVLAMGLVGPLFHRSFLRPFTGVGLTSKAIRWCLVAGIVVGCGNVGLLLVSRSDAALSSNATMVLLLAVILPPLVLASGLRSRDPASRSMLLGYAAMGLVTLLTLLPLAGVARLGVLSLYSTSIHGLLVALMLAAMLAMRRRDLRRQAAHTHETLRSERDRTRQALAERDEKDRFLSMLTHELRTPLSVIRMVLDQMRDRETAEALQRQLTLARSAVGDIDQVIERTVQVDRMERDALQTNMAPCRLAELVQQCIDATGQARRVQFEVDQAELMVQADPVMLRLMIANLLDNALKYSPPDSTVEVRQQAVAASCGGGPMIRVANPPGRAGRPDTQKLFSKYYRSEGAQHASGSGLGLYLVEGLARRMGLTVRCDPGDAGGPDAPVTFALCWKPADD